MPVKPDAPKVVDDASSTISVFGWGVFCLCLLLAVVAVYSRLYGLPSEYNSDALFAEDLYRDLIEQGGAWSQWGLPGAAMYLEMVLYAVVRGLAGNMHTGMAAYGALMCLLLSLGALYAVWPVLHTRESRYTALWVSCGLIVLQVLGGNPLYVWGKLAHGLTLSSALFACGMFWRLIIERDTLLLVPLLVLTAAMTASDMLYVLYFCIPAAGLLLYAWWMKLIPRSRVLLIGVTLVLAAGIGKGLDAHIRNFPPPLSPYFADFSRFFRSLFALLRGMLGVVGGAFGLVLATGWLGMILAWRTGGERRIWAGFFLLAMCTNLGLVALTGNDEARYCAMWYGVASTVGLLFFCGWLVERMRRVRAAAVWLPALAVGGLGLAAWTGVTTMLPPYLMPLAQALDALARESGVRTGIADYWDARPVNLLSTEGVVLIPVEGNGYRYLMFCHTRSMLRDRVDMFIDNPHSNPFNALNRELEIRANGQPDEEIQLPGDRRALVYHKGAHHPAEVELMLDGERLVPEMAPGDAEQWKGTMRLASGLTLTRVRTAPRDGRHVALLFFEEPVEQVRGTELSLYAAGDKLTRHRRELVKYITPQADGLLDTVLLTLIVPKRVCRVTQDNSAALPGGGSVVWAKLANWNSKQWLALFVNDGERFYRLK